KILFQISPVPGVGVIGEKSSAHFEIAPQLVITHVRFSKSARADQRVKQDCEKNDQDFSHNLPHPPYLKNKLPLRLLLPWMFRWQLRHAPPTIILILGFLPPGSKVREWKLMWHSRHNLMGGAFSRLG